MALSSLCWEGGAGHEWRGKLSDGGAGVRVRAGVLFDA